jgi:hypothetical protein
MHDASNTRQPLAQELTPELRSWQYAIRALRREILGFRFEYPLEIDTNAGPRESLHYYLYSDKLSWSLMSMDPNGIPKVRGRLYGEVYKPAYIAWWGLIHLGHFLRHGEKASRDIFLKQVGWLESFATLRTDGAVLWPNPFDVLQGATLLKAPWASSHDQGMVISALVRGYRMTGRSRLLDLLRGASRVFELTVEDGGVRIPLASGALYTELPGGPVPVILDGFQTALLGLYDLFTETGDPRVTQLFREGVQGLITTLPEWSYRGKWSWYGAGDYLCPPAYHILNRLQLEILARLVSDEKLTEYANSWDPARLSKLDRAEIYLAFVLTKNFSRMKHKTWRQNQEHVQQMATGLNASGRSGVTVHSIEPRLGLSLRRARAERGPSGTSGL